MQDFLKMATSQLGIGEADAASATGGILGLLKAQAKGNDFAELASKVPGLDKMLGKAPSGGGKGGLGGLVGSVASMFGSSKAGSVIGAADILGSLGGKAGGFVSLLSNYLKQKAGAGLVSKLFGNVPELKKLLG